MRPTTPQPEPAEVKQPASPHDTSVPSVHYFPVGIAPLPVINHMKKMACDASRPWVFPVVAGGGKAGIAMSVGLSKRWISSALGGRRQAAIILPFRRARLGRDDSAPSAIAI